MGSVAGVQNWKYLIPPIPDQEVRGLTNGHQVQSLVRSQLFEDEDF